MKNRWGGAGFVRPGRRQRQVNFGRTGLSARHPGYTRDKPADSSTDQPTDSHADKHADSRADTLADSRTERLADSLDDQLAVPRTAQLTDSCAALLADSRADQIVPGEAIRDYEVTDADAVIMVFDTFKDEQNGFEANTTRAQKWTKPEAPRPWPRLWPKPCFCKWCLRSRRNRRL